MHESSGPGEGTDEVVGYRGVTACHAVGISYRQLDYWARTALVVPSVRDAPVRARNGCTRFGTWLF